MDRKIGFIGSGNMSSTIIRGLVGNFDGIKSSIYVSNRSREKAEKLAGEIDINLSENNIDLVKNCDVIFLGIKPFIYGEVLSEISSYVTEDKLIVSLAAGVSMETVAGYFKHPVKIIRIMPNVAVNVGEGMIALSFNENVAIEEVDLIHNLLSSIALVDRIQENLMDAVTTISGCGPAFIAMFVEALADGSVLYGMPRDKAYIYAAQTLIGTGKMILEKNMHPGEIKDMVSSPRGVTIEGVYALEKRGFRNILMETIEACNKKMGQ